MSELKHYGILGMKWGVRRDNPSGKSKKGSDDYETAKKLKTQGTKNLSNAELKKAVERMNLEIQFKDLSRKQRSAGQTQASKVLKKIGDRIIDKSIEAGINAGLNIIKKKAS